MIDGNAPVSRNRQLLRFQNHRRELAYTIDLTLFDEIRNSHDEYKRILFMNKKLCHTIVAKPYFEQESVSRNMTVTACVSVRICTRFIAALEDIINGDHLEILHVL